MIVIDYLTSLYPKSDNGLKGFSCEFKPGVYALLGKNGSGKTTLFRHLVGALFPQKGSCQILGRNPEQRSPDLLKEIFLIPEEPFFPDVPSPDYIKGLSPFYPRFNIAILNDLLNRWEVPQSSSLRRMSQGQKKKFLIAFALATRSKIMLFDEPTNGLDIISKVSFKNLGTDMFHPDQVFIFATHQIKDIENLINNVTLIDNGKCWGNYPLEILKKKFITVKSIKNDDKALFSFKTQDYYLLLKKRKSQSKATTKTDDRETLDLEILFTAFLQNPQQFKDLMTNYE